MGAGYQVAQLVVGSSRRCEDAALVLEIEDGIVIAVADGAGGVGGGAAAAAHVVEAVRGAVGSMLLGAARPVSLLSDIDRGLASSAEGGQTTAVLCVVTGALVRGASVGDSGALLVDGAGINELTRNQVRKPLLGTGRAEPVAFRAALTGTLVVATDGLLNYARSDALRQLAVDRDIEDIPQRLVDLVRLRSGALPDDVGVVVCRLGADTEGPVRDHEPGSQRTS